MKRFSYSAVTSRFMSRGKLDTLVSFPLDEFNVDEYSVNDNAKSVTYQLYGVVNHFGGMGGGHYIAHATHEQSKPASEAQWYRFDDSSVSPADLKDIVSSSAYLLFYRRKDTIDETKEADREAEEHAVGNNDDGGDNNNSNNSKSNGATDVDVDEDVDDDQDADDCQSANDEPAVPLDAAPDIDVDANGLDGSD